MESSTISLETAVSQFSNSKQFCDHIKNQLFKQFSLSPHLNLKAESPWNTTFEAIVGNAGNYAGFESNTNMGAKTPGIDVTINQVNISVKTMINKGNQVTLTSYRLSKHAKNNQFNLQAAVEDTHKRDESWNYCLLATRKFIGIEDDPEQCQIKLYLIPKELFIVRELTDEEKKERVDLEESKQSKKKKIDQQKQKKQKQSISLMSAIGNASISPSASYQLSYTVKTESIEQYLVKQFGTYVIHKKDVVKCSNLLNPIIDAQINSYLIEKTNEEMILLEQSNDRISEMMQSLSLLQEKINREIFQQQQRISEIKHEDANEKEPTEKEQDQQNIQQIPNVTDESQNATQSNSEYTKIDDTTIRCNRCQGDPIKKTSWNSHKKSKKHIGQ